jgi:hypothetical protein
MKLYYLLLYLVISRTIIVIVHRLGHLSARVNFRVVVKRIPYIYINHKIFTMFVVCKQETQGRTRHTFSLGIDKRTSICSCVCALLPTTPIYIRMLPLQLSYFRSHRPPSRQIYHINYYG